MEKTKISINEVKDAMKKIIKQIDISRFNPDIIISINRGGCIPGVYLSHFLNKPHKMIDIKSIDNFEISIDNRKKIKSALIIDDINDSGKTFTIVKKIFNIHDIDNRYAALINNISSKAKIDYYGKIVNKKTNLVWYVFPWENWW